MFRCTDVLRSSSPGVAAQCLSTEASTDKSVPQDFVPPVAPPDTGGDGDPPDTGTIADGWFNADPVKITPTCPSSRVSLFWGRIVPERQDPPIHEEESINDQSEGLSKYLLGKHQRIDGKQPAPQDAPRDENIETTPVEASEEASIDFTPGCVQCSRGLYPFLNQYWTVNKRHRQASPWHFACRLCPITKRNLAKKWILDMDRLIEVSLIECFTLQPMTCSSRSLGFWLYSGSAGDVFDTGYKYEICNTLAVCRLYTENPSNKLTEKDVGKFYMFERSLLPEAFPQYYKIEVPDDVPKREPRGGSKSLAKTFKVL